MLTLSRATSVADLFGRTHFGSVNGVMAFGITLAQAEAPTAVALLYSTRFHYQVALGVLAVMAVAATLVYLAAERRVAHERKDPEAVDRVVSPSSEPV